MSACGGLEPASNSCLQVASTPTFEHLLALSDRVELPVSVDAPERVHPAGRERDPCPGDDVPDRSRHQNLVGASCGDDARGHIHGVAADAVSADFDLTEVYPGADPEVEPSDTSAERTGAGDGPGRAVERREHPVPGPFY